MAIDPNTNVYGTNNPDHYTAVVDVDVFASNPNDPTAMGQKAKARVVVSGGSVNAAGDVVPDGSAPLPAGTNRSEVAGVASEQLMAANPARIGGFINNASAVSIGISEFGDAAIGSLGTSTVLAGGNYTVRTSNAITVIAAAAASNVTAIEW